MVGALSALARQPGGGRDADPHEHTRSTSGTSCRPLGCPLSSSTAAGPGGRRRRGALHGRAHPRREVRRVARRDHIPWVGDADAILDEIEEFLTGVRHGPEPDRVLATVLFTDIVGSTERAAALGDRRWRDVLDQHHAVVRRELGALPRPRDRHRGRRVPRHLRRARARHPLRPRHQRRRAGARPRGPRRAAHRRVRAPRDDKLGGIAVHIGARVAALAGPGEVLVSSTVKDLVAGSGLRFEDRGLQPLKGVPGEWRLYALEPEGRRE